MYPVLEEINFKQKGQNHLLKQTRDRIIKKPRITCVADDEEFKKAKYKKKTVEPRQVETLENSNPTNWWTPISLHKLYEVSRRLYMVYNYMWLLRSF